MAALVGGRVHADRVLALGQGRLAVSVEKSRLPLSLLECFQKPTAEQKTIDLLRFILPLTSTSVIQET